MWMWREQKKGKDSLSLQRSSPCIFVAVILLSVSPSTLPSSLPGPGETPDLPCQFGLGTLESSIASHTGCSPTKIHSKDQVWRPGGSWSVQENVLFAHFFEHQNGFFEHLFLTTVWFVNSINRLMLYILVFHLRHWTQEFASRNLPHRNPSTSFQGRRFIAALFVIVKN